MTAEEMILNLINKGVLRRVVWCNRHDIAWASHGELGVAIDDCPKGERLIVDVRRLGEFRT